VPENGLFHHQEIMNESQPAMHVQIQFAKLTTSLLLNLTQSRDDATKHKELG
jgi:hypothetical protein